VFKLIAVFIIASFSAALCIKVVTTHSVEWKVWNQETRRRRRRKNTAWWRTSTLHMIYGRVR